MRLPHSLCGSFNRVFAVTKHFMAILTTLAIFAGVLLPPTVLANTGPQWWGDLTTEPQGVLPVAITHEKLTFDLRPLAEPKPILIEVIYDLYNPGPSIKLELVFVSGTRDYDDFQVWLDGQPLPSEPIYRY